MIVIGMDEVGMGSLAGDLVVVAAAFNIEEEMWDASIACPIEGGIKDSKKYSSEKSREKAAKNVMACSKFETAGYGIISADDINRDGISESLNRAQYQALEWIAEGWVPEAYESNLLLVDGNKPFRLWKGKQLYTPKADHLWWPVSAASVLAKVHRDWYMKCLNEEYPGYSLDKHKGYGTALHIKALKELGPSPAHRTQFVDTILRKNK